MRNGANSRPIAGLAMAAALALACAGPADARTRQPACAAIPLTSAAPSAGRAPARPAPASAPRYEINAALDPAAHLLRGSERLHWRNPTRSPVCTLYLHLDLNAFEHATTRWMRAREAQGIRHRPAAGEWGYTRIARIAQDGRAAVWIPVQPGGGAADERSLVRVDLPHPVPPGAVTALDIAFASRLPGAWAGLGHQGDLHLAARWFPRVAVLEATDERGATPRWAAPPHAGQPVPRTDPAVFDVRLDLPADHALATGGQAVGAPGARGARRLHRVRLDGAADFAWIAAPNLVPLQYTYTPPGGAPMRLRVLHRPDEGAAAAATLGAVADALAQFSAALPPYPQRSLTAVVVADTPAPRLGGWAYPGLITVSGQRSGAPALDARLERQAIAGVGAGYFAGLLPGDDDATQVHEQALIGYWSDRVLRARGHRVPAPERWPARLGFAPSLDSFAATRLRARLQRPPAGLRAAADRTTLALHDLEARIGAPAMDRAFRALLAPRRAADTAGHARDADPGERLLLDALAFPAPVDDRIAALRSEELLPQPGYVLHRGRRIELTRALLDRAIAERRAAWKRGPNDTAPGPFPYRTVVDIQRHGALVPQLLEVRFADGSLRRVRWHDAQPVQRFEWITASRALSAQLDPQRQVLLDRNKLDDGRSVALDTTPARRWAGDLAALVQSLAALLVGL